QPGDVVALGGRTEARPANMGVLSPDGPDARALNIPVAQAEILVANKEVTSRPLTSSPGSQLAAVVQLQRIERSGVPLPIGLETTLQKRDVMFVTGLQPAVSKAGEIFGVIARHSSATDLLTLSFGMILGFLIGLIEVPAFGANVGLGNAGGLLLSGIIVSSISSRLRFFGNTPTAARNILEDLGL